MNLDILTEYWYRYDRPIGLLFPSTVRNGFLTNEDEAVESFIKKYAQKLGLPEGVAPYTMRHCFACHTLEDGVSHIFVHQLLGHRSPNPTEVYLQITSKALMGNLTAGDEKCLLLIQQIQEMHKQGFEIAEIARRTGKDI